MGERDTPNYSPSIDHSEGDHRAVAKSQRRQAPARRLSLLFCSFACFEFFLSFFSFLPSLGLVLDHDERGNWFPRTNKRREEQGTQSVSRDKKQWPGERSRYLSILCRPRGRKDQGRSPKTTRVHESREGKKDNPTRS